MYVFCISLLCGILMFAHYGCSVIRNNIKKLPWYLSTAIVCSLVASVQILVASVTQNLDQLIYGCLLYAIVNTSIHSYLHFIDTSNNRSFFKHFTTPE